jgi:hypothetical protein
MSKAFRKHFASFFIDLQKKGDVQTLGYIAVIRTTQSDAVYEDLIRAFLEANPRFANKTLRRGRTDFGSLLSKTQVEFNSVEKELAFASAVLKNCVSEVNEFVTLSSYLQSEVLNGNFEVALKTLQEYRNTYGWSVWGVELEFAIATYAISDAEERRRHLASLTACSTPRLATLLGQILTDRNDPSIPVGAFLNKCARSFPHIGLSKPMQDYMRYRATGEIKDLEKVASTLLTLDFNNSIIDYYETLIEICTDIATTPLFKRLKNSVTKLVTDLISFGIDDIRLDRLRFCCGGEPPTHIKSSEEKNLTLLIQTMISPISTPEAEVCVFLSDVLDRIVAIKLRGSVAEVEILDLMKLGLNLRSLPIGNALHNFASKAPNSISDSATMSCRAQFTTRTIRFEDLLAYDVPGMRTMIDGIKNNNEFAKINCKAESLNNVLIEDFSSILEISTQPHALIYAARELAKQNKLAGAILCAEQLDTLGIPWDRHASKVRILCAIEEGDIEPALISASRILSADSGYAYELPLAQFFYRTKWSDYKNFDPITVAIVAHHAFYVTAESNARYICRMACREIRNKNILDRLVYRATNGNVDDRDAVIEYLSGVWVEDNLTMAGFENMDEIRRTRIQVLQMLLQLVPEDPNGRFAQEIKELTFNEMVSKGLKHIDSSRIFVNEGAIARWAEKELSADYERWKNLSLLTYPSTQELDDILKGYLMGDDGSLSALLRQETYTKTDATLMSVVDRLLERFLFDPADGLNCYLSSRIRHGSLKGILLGPLEEAGLLGLSEQEISMDWRVRMGNVPNSAVPTIVQLIHSFDKSVNDMVKRLISESVQIRSLESPLGRIFPTIDAEFKVRSFSQLAKDAPLPNFVLSCFEVFWLILSRSLDELSEYIRTSVKHEIQNKFDELILSLQTVCETTVALTTSLKTVATETQGQCDLIANWFQLGGALDKQIFSLEAAIEIAKKGTQYVYRSFPIAAVDTTLPSEAFSLTSLGVSAISDCLYIMLENSFKHSGLKSDLAFIRISSDFSAAQRTLSLSVTHPLSKSRLEELRDGGLELIREKYIDNASVDRASFEGGSGFAKLIRLTRMLDHSVCPKPLTIELTSENLVTVQAIIPVYLRGDAYDAYFC